MYSAIEIIELYLDERPNLTAGSRKAYFYSLRRFYRFLKQNSINFEQLKLADMIRYHGTFAGCSDLTVSNNFTIVRNHLIWGEEAGLLINPIKTNHYLNRPKRKYHIFRKKPLTPEQLNKLLEKPNKETLKGLRDFALLLLLSMNGIRVIEAIRANIGDIVQNGLGLQVQRKGSTRRDEVVRLSEPVQNAVHAYLLKRENFTDESPLFESVSYNHIEGRRLTQISVSRLIKDYLRQIGLNDPKITAHSLRHTAASTMIRMGANLHDLQKFLGHTNFQTSQMYLKAVDQERLFEQDYGQKIYDFITQSKE